LAEWAAYPVGGKQLSVAACVILGRVVEGRDGDPEGVTNIIPDPAPNLIAR
jgi:hypothetical protein